MKFLNVSTNSKSAPNTKDHDSNLTRTPRWHHLICAGALLALTALNAPAAITFDAASTGSAANPSSSVAWSHTVGSGNDRMLVVGVVAEHNADQYATTVTYGTQSLTKVTGSAATGSGTPLNATELWYLPAPNVGTAAITITFASSQSNGAECGAVSLFGVKQSAPEAVAIDTGAATGTTYSLAITTLTNGAWLVDVVNHGSGNAANTINTTSTGMTRRWNSAAGGQLVGACATREVATAGAVTDTWSTSTGTSSRKAQSIAAFTPAPTVVSVWETFDSYANGTVLTTIGGGSVWTIGTGYTVIDAGGVAGSKGLSTGGGIFNWKGQPFTWSTLATGAKVAMSMDFQSDASAKFDDDRVGWTITPDAATTTGSQLALQLDNSQETGMVLYHNGTRNQLNALAGIKASTWYRFNVEFTKLTATSAGIVGTLTELDVSGNPTGTPYVGTIADTSTFSNPPSTALFGGSQCPSFKNYNTLTGNADNVGFITTTPAGGPTAPTVTLGLTGSPMAEAAGVATVTATLSAAYTLPVTVNLAFSGTATLTTDYTRSGTSIVIPAGSTTGSITLTAVQDAIYENPNETIIVDIDTVVNGTESGTQQVSATITDDDPAPAAYVNFTGGTYTQNFDSMGVSSSGGTVTTPTGWWVSWYPTGGAAGAFADMQATNTARWNDGSLAVDNTVVAWNCGVAGTGLVTDRALGLGVSSGSGGTTAPASSTRNIMLEMQNNSGAAINSFQFSNALEYWHSAGNASQAEGLEMYYSINGVDWILIGSRVTLSNAGSNVALDGNAPANRTTMSSGIVTPSAPIANGAIFYLRWYDANDSGTDGITAIDDFSFTSASTAPNAPVVVAPTSGATGVSTSPTLTVSVSDPNSDPMTVTFYGRAKSAVSPGPDFAIAVLPDTQFYSESYPAILTSQTQWIVDNRVSRSIVYVTGEGDVANAPSDTQDKNASDAYALLENPLTTGLPQGIPFGVPTGNHDTYDSPSYTYFDKYFPTSRFSGRSYYGGSYPTTGYRNHYDLFTAGGMDFIVLSLEFNAGANSALMTWANGILAANSTRRAIVVSHSILQAGSSWPTPAAWSTDGGSTLFPALSANPNLFLMLCGHNHGQGRRHEAVGSRFIDVLLADWQSDTNGGNGFLRTLDFSPANHVIHVKTYSPYTLGSKTDGDNQFDLSYTMTAQAAFTVIGTNSGVASGSQTSVTWPGLTAGTTYEWYATASDGTNLTTGTTNTFTTQAAASQPTVTLGLTGSPMAEAAGVATVTATLSATYASPVTVNLAFSGTATVTTDYTASANSISIPAGSTTGLITLTAVQDSIYEIPNETIVVDISTVTNGTESGIQQMTATITDDDPAPVASNFTAYNDCAMSTTTPANVTNWQTQSNVADPAYTPSGLLKDFTSGLTSSVTCTASASAALVLWTDPVVNVPFTTGTDAANIFNGKLDFTGSPELNSDTEYYQYTFTGLNPAKTYEFVTTMNRANSGYTTRLTTYTISGATSFVNASSAGTTISTSAMANDSTTLCSGYNTVNGYVARWTNITASSGTFSVKAMRVAGTKAYGFSMFMLKETLPAQAQYVIEISVDGLGGTYLKKLFDGTATGGPYSIPNFTRLNNEGASTLTAHCDNDNWETLPNHTSILTARQQVGTTGHNWTLNSDPAVGQTLHTNKPPYVASVFDVAHDNDLRTGMYANKTKFSLFHTYGSWTGGGSYDAANGGTDTTGINNGTNKVDNTYIDTTLGGVIVDTYIAQQKTASPNRYAFVHINEPDANGHGSGWGSATWNSSVVTVDAMLGKLFKLIETDVPAMKNHTVIILTADHGNQDNPPAGVDRYSVPFFVWGPGVSAGADLYALNVGKRQVAASYPMTTYTGLQPIRNAEASNLALKMLGLGPIPGSTIAPTQDLSVSAPLTLPTVSLSLTGNPLAEAAGAATVTTTLSATYPLPVTVNLAFSGTATLTTDYTRSATSIVIPALSTTGTVTLTAVQDAVYDPGETIVVDIDTVVNATENGTQQVTATITDDDPAPPYRSFTGAAITENFDGLGTAGTVITPLVGWDAGQFNPVQANQSGPGNGITTVTDTSVVVDDGTIGLANATASIYNLGTTGSTDRALGSMPKTASGDLYYQLAIKNNSGVPITSFVLTYTGEEWASAPSTNPDSLTVWYSDNNAASGFVSMGSAFTFTAPQLNLSTKLDGNAAANRTLITGTFTPAVPIAPGNIFYLRWYDRNDPAQDHVLGIDDLTVALPPNQPPVFSGYAVSGTTNKALSIYPAKILALASDPDGDAMSLTRVFGPSAHGGTATLAGNVNYTPPAGYAGTDTFDVEITDARGATVRGTVTVTLAAVATGEGAKGQNQTYFNMHGGQADMVFRGIPGRSYTIQRSTDLTNWIDLVDVTAGADGKISYTDPAPPMPQGFYRTKSN